MRAGQASFVPGPGGGLRPGRAAAFFVHHRARRFAVFIRPLHALSQGTFHTETPSMRYALFLPVALLAGCINTIPLPRVNADVPSPALERKVVSGKRQP